MDLEHFSPFISRWDSDHENLEGLGQCPALTRNAKNLFQEDYNYKEGGFAVLLNKGPNKWHISAQAPRGLQDSPDLLLAQKQLSANQIGS